MPITLSIPQPKPVATFNTTAQPAGGLPSGSSVAKYNQTTPATLSTPVPAPASPAKSTNKATGTSSTSSSSTLDPVAAAYYANEVNALKGVLGTLPTMQDQGTASIQNNANKSLNDLNTQESATESNIAGERDQANKNKASSLNSIDQNVADTVDSFKRLTGAAHAGDSAFAREFVPIATARQGSTQRQGVFGGYAQDMGNLDTALTGAKTAYNSNKDDITNKMNNDLLTFLQNIGTQKDTVNGQIRQDQYAEEEANGGTPANLNALSADYTTNPADATAALRALFSQYANPTYTVNPVAVNVPNVSNYAQDPLVAQLAGSNPDVQTALLPYLPQIKKAIAASGTTS